jgi:mannose-6-phosphate isomerase-like protein (cupin superfamily)
MNRRSLFAEAPWDGEDDETGLRHRSFWRPENARMGATLWELRPGATGMRMHMHYGAEEMFFVLSGRPLWRSRAGEEELAPGDHVSCPEGRAGLHAFGNPSAEPARILAMSAGSFPDVVAYPEHNYAWVATRVPELPPGEDPGIIARFDFDMDRPDGRLG